MSTGADEGVQSSRVMENDTSSVIDNESAPYQNIRICYCDGVDARTQRWPRDRLDLCRWRP